jgi:signal transduction histidine kinase
MLKRTLESAARTRWALPAVAVLALLAMLVNELTYQHSRFTLNRGITLTDARISAARILQELTDAELAVRSYILGANSERLARWERARSNMPAVKEAALRLSSQVDPEVAAKLQQTIGALQQRMDHLGQWVALMRQGRTAEAAARAAEGVPGQSLFSLRQQFDDILAQAASAQQVARVSLYDAMMINRVAVHVLVLLSVLGLALFVRELRARDAERAHEKVWLEGQVRERTAALRELAGHLVSAREDERARVARELHDEMGGLLTAMKLEFARLKRVEGLPEPALQRVKGIEARLNDGIALKRRIVENLRPSSLDQLGLRAALQLLCEDVAQQSGLVIEPELQDVPLGKEAELSLYRLVQESLTNTIKYAQASRVGVSLAASGGQVALEVQDDGQGFDPALARPGHHGLAGMRMRVEAHAGTLAIHSQPGGGTRIRAELPLQHAGA